ncbi:MAG: hypothetical protein SF182_28690 [Deltaproteobacteria bacterium]|nr:hypothetical protein [Deltaproteobacteria bacterium]
MMGRRWGNRWLALGAGVALAAAAEAAQLAGQALLLNGGETVEVRCEAGRLLVQSLSGAGVRLACRTLGATQATAPAPGQLSGTLLRLRVGDVVEARCTTRRLQLLQVSGAIVRLACRPGATATATRAVPTATRIPATPSRPAATATRLPPTPTRPAATATAPPPSPTPSVTPTCAGSCDRDPTLSVAYGLWVPGRFDTCSKALHDAFSVVGPDGKRYPSWHPPQVVDPASGRLCSFGHEHGRDPSGSHLAAWLAAHFADARQPDRAGIPFGYANESLDAWIAAVGGHQHRHEDHVGHKLEWENDLQLRRSNTPGGQGSTPIDVTCDVLAKIHQGTHSPDAFGMNVHEVLFAARCSDGTELIATIMARFGAANQFLRSCDRATPVDAGTAHDMPAGSGGRGIPDRSCALRDWLVPAGQWSGNFYEFWLTGNYIRTAAGRQLAYFDPGFAVFDPSRYFDAGAPNALRRVIDLCWEVEPNGDRARGGACEAATDYGRRTTPLAWDDPASPFAGTHREVYFNNFHLENAGGPRYWYTDPYGGNAAPEPFPGAIRQLVASITDNRPTLESQALGADRDYGGHGVHAPN